MFFLTPSAGKFNNRRSLHEDKLLCAAPVSIVLKFHKEGTQKYMEFLDLKVRNMTRSTSFLFAITVFSAVFSSVLAAQKVCGKIIYILS